MGSESGNQGVPIAQEMVGIMYITATDVPNNYELAREWLLKPAVQDIPQCQNALGVLYMQGLGVEARR